MWLVGENWATLANMLPTTLIHRCICKIAKPTRPDPAWPKGLTEVEFADSKRFEIPLDDEEWKWVLIAPPLP